MAGGYREYLTKNLPVPQPVPNPEQAQRIIADAINRMLASQNAPSQAPVDPRYVQRAQGNIPKPSTSPYINYASAAMGAPIDPMAGALPGTYTMPPAVAPQPVVAQPESVQANPYDAIDQADAALVAARDWYMADGGPESESALAKAQADYDLAVKTNRSSVIPNAVGNVLSDVANYKPTLTMQGVGSYEAPSIKEGAVKTLELYNKPMDWNTRRLAEDMYQYQITGKEPEFLSSGGPDYTNTFDPSRDYNWNHDAESRLWAIDPANKEKIKAVYEVGLDLDGDGVPELKGPEAVWLAFNAENPKGFLDKLVTGLGYDPLTIALFLAPAAGAVRGGAAVGAETALVSGRTTQAAILKAIEIAMGTVEKTTVATNAVADLPFTLAGKAATATKAGLGRSKGSWARRAEWITADARQTANKKLANESADVADSALLAQEIPVYGPDGRVQMPTPTAGVVAARPAGPGGPGTGDVFTEVGGPKTPVDEFAVPVVPQEVKPPGSPFGGNARVEQVDPATGAPVGTKLTDAPTTPGTKVSDPNPSIVQDGKVTPGQAQARNPELVAAEAAAEEAEQRALVLADQAARDEAEAARIRDNAPTVYDENGIDISKYDELTDQPNIPGQTKDTTADVSLLEDATAKAKVTRSRADTAKAEAQAARQEATRVRESAPTVSPEDMTPEVRIEGVKDGSVSVFDPYPGGPRLIDETLELGRSADPVIAAKAQAFESINKGKRIAATERERAIQAQIKSVQDQIDPKMIERGKYAGDTPLQREIDALFLPKARLINQQKMNGLEHTVDDVAADYSVAFQERPVITVTESKIDITRPPRTQETFTKSRHFDRTPGGNAISDPKGVGVDKVTGVGKKSYTVTGKGGKSVIAIREPSGLWTIEDSGRGRKMLATDLTEHEAVMFADKSVPPAGVSYTKETNATLMEKYVVTPVGGTTKAQALKNEKDAAKIIESLRARADIAGDKELINRLKELRLRLAEIQSAYAVEDEIWSATQMAIVKRNADLVEQGFTPTESEIMAERIVSASSGLDDALAKADAMLQGHYPAAPSAVPDVVPEPADFSKSVPPKEDGYAYHATSKYRMRDIEESGAIETFPPDHGTDQDMWPDGSVTPRSYWSESPKSAQSFYPDDGPPVLIRSKRGSLRIEKGTGDLYTETPVSLGRDVVEFWGKDGRWHRLGGTALVPPKSSVVTSFDKLAVLVTRVKAFIRQQWENQQQIGFIHPSIRRMMKNVPGPILPEPDWAALKAMEPSPNTTSQIVMQQIRGELSDDVATALESKIRTIRVRATKDTINPKGKWREGTPEEVAVWAKMNGEDIPASGSYTGRVHEDVSRQTSSGRTIGYRNSSDVIEIKEFTQLDVLDRIVRDNLEATNAELANLFSKEIVALTGRRAPARVKLNPVFEKMKNSISNVNAAGRSALLNNPLNVIRGIGSDAASDSIRAAMEGHLPAAVESLNLWSYIRKLTGQETPVQRIMQWTGQDAPQDLKVLYGRTDMDVAGRTATNKMISNTVGLKEGGTADKVVGALTGVIDNKTGAQLRAGADNVRREAVFEESLESMAGPSGRRFREQAMAWGEKHGIEGSSVYAYLDDLGRWYSPAEVNARMLELARDAGLADDVAVKFADRLSRNWQSEMSQMIKKADAEQKRLYFTYERTNLDETLSKVIFYHYWMTRAVPAYIKIGLRNPYIAASWIRSWEDVKKRAEEQGLPKSLGGYLKVMGSRDGWYGSINIWNVFLPIMDMRPDLMAQGKWDQVTQFFAVAPILSAFVSTIGLDNSVVDVFSTYTMRNMGMAIINKVRAETGRSPITGDGYEQLMRSGYEHINDFLQWADIPFAQEQAYRDPSINKRLMIRYVVGSIVAERTGVPTDQWVEGGPEYAMWADAVNDGEAGVENELYQEAQLQWADETLSGAVKNTVIPGGYRTSFGPQVELSAGGPNAGDLTQGQKDTKKLFGSGSPEDVKLDALQAQYMDIGSSQQKAFAEGYKSIVADDPIKGYDNGYVIQIGSEHYTKTQLLDLTKDERFTLAKAWVNQHGGTEILQDYRDKRDAFTAKHPEFGEVTDYQQIAYTYDGGLHQFRMDRAAGNPNFKKAMLDHREYLLKEVGVDPALIEVELDNWAPTIAAYKAANGIQDSLYDSPPISTGDQGTVNTLVNMGMLDKNKGGGGGGSYGGKKSTADTLNKSLKSYETDMKLVQDLLQQYGVDPAVLTSSNPYAIQTVNSLVGDLMPKETALMKDYFDWIALQPPGADTSPEAFAAIIDAIAQDKAA